MRPFFWFLVVNLLAFSGAAQSFEVSGIQESYKGLVGDAIRAPIRLTNTSDKAITVVVKKMATEIGGTQKNYYCIDGNCLDSRVEEYQIKIEPGQSYQLLHVVLEAGLAAGPSHARYLAFNKSHPADAVEFDLNFVVEENTLKQDIYSSRGVILRNVYPNPVTDFAYVDYTLLDDQVKAKIVIHSILGNSIDEHVLPPLENKVKIRADALSSGIYFYTLYINNEGVITRKLIVKK